MLMVNTIVNSIFVNLQLTSHLTDYIVLCADEELTAEQSKTLSEWARRPLYQPTEPIPNIVVHVEGSSDSSVSSSDVESDECYEEVRIVHNTPTTKHRRSRDSESEDVGLNGSKRRGSD